MLDLTLVLMFVKGEPVFSLVERTGNSERVQKTKWYLSRDGIAASPFSDPCLTPVWSENKGSSNESNPRARSSSRG